MQTHPFSTLNLSTSAIGQHTHYFKSIDSTNRWLREHVAESPHGTVVFAGFQSAGRGRLGRQWVTPPDTALLHSILVKPNWPLTQSGWIVMIAGLAIVETIKEIYGLPARLKWPNDIVIPHAGTLYKVGGILVDTHIEEDQLIDAIIGIGLNLNIPKASLPPTAHLPAGSLLSLSDKETPLAEFAGRSLTRLEAYYERCNRRLSPLASYRNALITLNQAVTISGPSQDEPIWGQAVDVDEWGRLLVQLNDGEIKAIAAGDVTLRPVV